MKSADEIRHALACCTGTENYWKIFSSDDAPRITDGVKLMADLCDAVWLITAIAFCQIKESVKKEPFQVWTLTLVPNGAVLVGEDGNKKEIAKLEMEFTDFPLPEGITLYLCDGILMLPSEY